MNLKNLDIYYEFRRDCSKGLTDQNLNDLISDCNVILNLLPLKGDLFCLFERELMAISEECKRYQIERKRF